MKHLMLIALFALAATAQDTATVTFYATKHSFLADGNPHSKASWLGHLYEDAIAQPVNSYYAN